MRARATTLLWPGLALAGLACGDRPPPTAPPAPSPSACTNHAVATDPADGATDAYYRSPVRFTLAEPDPFAVIRVYGGDSGTQIAGATRVDGTEVTWDGVLLFGADHTAELSLRCGTTTISFATQGELPGTPEDSRQGSYRWRLSTGEASPLLGVVLDGDLWTSAIAHDEGRIVWRAASGDLAIDPCAPTAELVGPSDGTAFAARGDVLALDGLIVWEPALTGEFGPFYGTIVDGTVRGATSVEPFAERLGLAAGAVCDLVGCGACPDGSPDPVCVALSIEGIGAEHVTWIAVEERSQQQIAGDPSCTSR